MREYYTASEKISDFYSDYEEHQRLRQISDILDGIPKILNVVAKDLIKYGIKKIRSKRIIG